MLAPWLPTREGAEVMLIWESIAVPSKPNSKVVWVLVQVELRKCAVDC